MESKGCPVTAVDSKGKYTWAVILVTILVISKIIMGGTLVKAAWLVFCVLVWSFIGIAAVMVRTEQSSGPILQDVGN